MSHKALNTWKGCLWQDGALWPLHTTPGSTLVALLSGTQSNPGLGAGWCSASLLSWQPITIPYTKYDMGLVGDVDIGSPQQGAIKVTPADHSSHLKDRHSQAGRP